MKNIYSDLILLLSSLFYYVSFFFLTNETHYHVLDQKDCKFVIKDQVKRIPMKMLT